MEGIVVVAPFSTGALLAKRVKELGHKLVLVYMNDKLSAGELECDVKLNFTGDVEALINEINACPFKITHILPGAENGVTLANQLTHEMGFLGNPFETSAARRSKYLMGEVIRAAGVRAPMQKISCVWEDLENFIQQWNPTPFKVIVKPNQSAGSDDVFLCTDIAQVEAAFNTINGAINEVGEVNEGVLVQEYLEGTEYVVDSVSVDGVHKVVAIWEYDKRHVNGQFNVYFGMRVCDPTRFNDLVKYNAQVLDALQIYHGPAHAEIKMTQTGPCLIEVGSRLHGGHGTWKCLANKAYGYNQIDVTLDSYLAKEKVLALGEAPPAPKMFGKEVFLVSTQQGVLKSIPGLEFSKTLNSFLCSELTIKPNQNLCKTIDLFTMPGRIQLMHEEKERVEMDSEIIYSLLEAHKFFAVHDINEKEQQVPSGPQES